MKKDTCSYLRHGLGVVGCVRARGVGLGDWGVVLGLDGLVLGLGMVGLGFGSGGFWGVFLVLGEGQVGFAGWRAGVL